MSLFNILDIGGSAMSAESIRLNATASNLANAESAASDPKSVYRPIQPVFKAIHQESINAFDRQQWGHAAVQVSEIVHSQRPPRSIYQPGHPLSNSAGYVFFPNVNVVEEMTNMISASRAYQSSTDLINTAKEMMLKTMTLGA